QIAKVDASGIPSGKCKPALIVRTLRVGSDRRVFELIAQNFGQPLGRETAQIGKREARRRGMTAAAVVLREDRQIDVAVGAAPQADALASQIEQRDDRASLSLVEMRRDFAA